MKTVFVQRFALVVLAMIFAVTQAHAQSSKVKKPEPLGYSWADKFLEEIYLLDVDVETCTKEIDDARYYLAEMAEDPAVFLKEKGTTDFKTVVKISREKFEQGKAAKKSLDELFSSSDFNGKLTNLTDQLKQVSDTKSLNAVGKNLKEAVKNLTAVPKSADKLGKRAKSIVDRADNVLKQADQLDMFKKAPVVSALTSNVSSLKSTAEKMPVLADVSVKTLDLYKKVLTNIKVK